MKHEKNIIEKLSLIRDQLRSQGDTDSKNHLRLVGIVLYDYIQSTPELKNIWTERLDYMPTLRKDACYIAAENEAWEIAGNLARIGYELRKKLSEKEHHSKAQSRKARGEFFGKFPDMFARYLDDTKRRSLLDRRQQWSISSKFGATMNNDVVRRETYDQYASLFSHFSQSVIRQQISESFERSEIQDFVHLLNRFQTVLRLLEERLVSLPSQLYLESFEKVQIAARDYLNRLPDTAPTHQGRFRPARPHRREQDEGGFVELKQAGIEVCERLIWEMANADNAKPADGREPIWLDCGDFKFCHDPLALKKGTEVFAAATGGKDEKTKDKRKALRVIAAFAPQPGNPLPRSYENMEELKKVLQIRKRAKKKAQSPNTQVSIARTFLENTVHSAYTISDGRSGRYMLERR